MNKPAEEKKRPFPVAMTKASGRSYFILYLLTIIPVIILIAGLYINDEREVETLVASNSVIYKTLVFGCLYDSAKNYPIPAQNDLENAENDIKKDVESAAILKEKTSLKTNEIAEPKIIKAHENIKQFTHQLQKSSGISVKMIGLSALNEKNNPDYFEAEAITLMQQGRENVVKSITSGDHQHVKSMFPIKAQKSCVSCHSYYKDHLNEVVGSLVVNAPINSVMEKTTIFKKVGIIFVGLVLVVICTGVYLLGWRWYRERLTIQRELKLRSVTDQVTGLLNWDAVMHQLNREILRCRRYKVPLSVALIDIDHFAKLNDRFGRKTGDDVLQIVADKLRMQVRDYDIIGRTGSAEYVVVFPEISVRGAYDIAERIRLSLSEKSFEVGWFKVPVTVSIGIVQYEGSGQTGQVLMSKAQGALYNAKANGRNCTEYDDIGH